jgi:hypothetical protein
MKPCGLGYTSVTKDGKQELGPPNGLWCFEGTGADKKNPKHWYKSKPEPGK